MKVRKQEERREMCNCKVGRGYIDVAGIESWIEIDLTSLPYYP